MTITRRDGEPLLLVKASDLARDQRGLSITAQIVGAVLQTDPVGLAERFLQPYPWVEFLAQPDREAFAREVVDVTRACAAIAQFGRLESVVSSWQATAEALAAAIDATGADLEWLEDPVRVPRPTV